MSPASARYRVKGGRRAEGKLPSQVVGWLLYFYSLRMVGSGQTALVSVCSSWGMATLLYLQLIQKLLSECLLCARHLPASGGAMMNLISLLRMSPQFNGRNGSFLCTLMNALIKESVRKTSRLTRSVDGQRSLLEGDNNLAGPWRTIDGEKRGEWQSHDGMKNSFESTAAVQCTFYLVYFFPVS